MEKMVEAKTIDQIWEADRLERRQHSDFLYNFIVGEISKRKHRGKRSSYSLNIDAKWGGGKSFFLERFGEQIAEQGHVVAYVNAWRDDHASDPYIAIMAAIDRAFAPYVKKDPALKAAWDAVVANGGPLVVKALGGALKVLIKRHLGFEPDDIYLGDNAGPLKEAAEVTIEQSLEVGTKEIDKLFDGALEKMIGHFHKTDQAMRNFREKLAASVEALDSKKSDRKAPFFVLIDELDRCRPSYAVLLLERIKHLFEVDGVAFVFATNSEQLQHSITGTYGQGFNGFSYLKRFFDRTYIFSETSPWVRVEELCGSLDFQKIRVPDRDLTAFIYSGCLAYDLDLRAIEQIFEMIDVTVFAWPHKIPLDMLLLFPLCVTFYQKGEVDWMLAKSEIPKDWKIGHVQVVSHNGDTRDLRIDVARAFSAATDRFGSMEKIMSVRSSQVDNPSDEYVRETFLPEYNGLEVKRSAPSIQTSLLYLVANAGRLTQASLHQEPS
ncbi:KAP family P-loop NTPase fold protein [Rhizobium laguerreae]|uniref:KAP NTPase domain-containing protein n=1 Tax=Rhizobium laguerreae TaxID=1076926 RepID=A0A6N9ZKH0_9HYPH|nr:P-loop NTPase fold protein [Rhizobium laguerreae]NEH93495.1 hypothetical protein [Rhizobium laguerreae]